MNLCFEGASLVALVVKNPLASAGDIRDTGSIPGLGRSLEEGMATHSSILAWRISWTEEPGGLQSTGSQRVRHDRAQDRERWRWDSPGAPKFCPYFNTSLILLALSRARNSLCIFSLRFCNSQIKESFIHNDTFF